MSKIVETTLFIVDMQEIYVPTDGCNFYIKKRAELVRNILELATNTILHNGRVVIVNTHNHGDIIPELAPLSKCVDSVVILTKWYNSLIHFDQVKRYHQIRNTSTIKKALKSKKILVTGVNTSWCVLETVKGINKYKGKNSNQDIIISVPHNAIMNIPYPEDLSTDKSLLILNKSESIKNDYRRYIREEVLIGESLFIE